MGRAKRLQRRAHERATATLAGGCAALRVALMTGDWRIVLAVVTAMEQGLGAGPPLVAINDRAPEALRLFDLDEVG